MLVKFFPFPATAPLATPGSVFGARPTLGLLYASSVAYAFLLPLFGLPLPTPAPKAISAIVAWGSLLVHGLGSFARFCSLAQAVLRYFLWSRHSFIPTIRNDRFSQIRKNRFRYCFLRCWCCFLCCGPDFVLFRFRPGYWRWFLHPLMSSVNWWSRSSRPSLPSLSRWESHQLFR